MTSAFVAATFTPALDRATGKFDPELRKRIEALIACLREAGFSVYSAHILEEWGNSLESPPRIVKRDFQAIREADIMVAYVSNPTSYGVHIELGWASALHKEIVILQDAETTPLIEGLGKLTQLHLFRGTWADNLARLRAYLYRRQDRL